MTLSRTFPISAFTCSITIDNHYIHLELEPSANILRWLQQTITLHISTFFQQRDELFLCSNDAQCYPRTNVTSTQQRLTTCHFIVCSVWYLRSIRQCRTCHAISIFSRSLIHCQLCACVQTIRRHSSRSSLPGNSVNSAAAGSQINVLIHVWQWQIN